jgi:thermolysin
VHDVRQDELAMTHTRLQQTHRGVPVFGGEAIVHLRPDGAPFAITDDTLPDVEVSPVPTLTPAHAIDRAVAHSGAGQRLTAAPKADLFVLRISDEGYVGEGRDRLVYRVSLRREDGSAQTSMPVVFIDAHSGEKLWAYDNLQTATGTSLYSGTVTINSYLSGSTYYLEDIPRKVGTFNYNNTTSTISRFTDTNDVWGEAAQTNQRAGVDAHYGAEKVYDYYLNVHGRRGIDGSGGPASTTSIDGVTGLIGSRVHYSTNYNNAFWNGSYMTYGDGDGSTFSPLVSLDITGHEMTHGVTERTAGLIYSGESGALNESMSDVFGALVERSVKGEGAGTWKVGEECYTPANGTNDALRYMDNPHAAPNSGFTSDDDPDHYSERYTGTSDNGGVHINSGIANKAFYLVAKGGTHHLTSNTLTGIGADAAGQIWYKALTTYMTSSTNFAGARTATLNAAAALYGATSTQYGVVSCAWAMVGVGSDACTGTTPPPSGTERITNGGFETSVSPWVQSGNGAFYVANGNYPHGGTGYVYYGTANSRTGQGYQQFTIPSTATSANLTFWLNVTSSETTTTTQYDKLFVEIRNTSGTLLQTVATFSNLNKGTAGAYSQKGSYNLLAYKGQTIRLQFRATTDSSLATTFRVDDVSVK